MKLYPFATALVLGVGILAAPPLSVAEGLPDLGEAAQAEFSPAVERRTGESIMLEVRRDPAWLGDPEINGYLNRIGNRLAAQSEDARQEFEFFVLRDSTLNAFAMPGGYIGVHTGLILAAASESELAAVLAHEISHVTQRHLARLINKSGQGQVTSLLALAVAILAARSSPDLAVGAAMAGQGAAIQNQLNYSRDFEREADRVGLGLLERSGFDIRGMSGFFERMQKFGRLYENNAPGYLRTHPLTTERLADMGNRIQSRPYKQAADSLEFQLVRAKLRVQEGTAQDAVTEFQTRLRDRSFAGAEAAVRYGLAQALLRDGKAAAAEREMGELRRLKAESPMIETLAAQLRQKQGDPDRRRRHPARRPAALSAGPRHRLCAGRCAARGGAAAAGDQAYRGRPAELSVGSPHAPAAGAHLVDARAPPATASRAGRGLSAAGSTGAGRGTAGTRAEGRRRQFLRAIAGRFAPARSEEAHGRRRQAGQGRQEIGPP